MALGMGKEVAVAMRKRGPRFSLNENLWGGLQQHLCLAEHVYARLPFEEFFNLRTVCKDWYNVACKRLALKDRIHQPVFALFARSSWGDNLEGFLSYKASLNSWRWRVTYTHDKLDQTALTEGRLVYRSGDQCIWCLDCQGRCSELPLPPGTVLGILSVGPRNLAEKCLNVYKDYKVVRGGQGFDTQVYDSRTRKWEMKPCRPKAETCWEMQASIGCVECNGRVYITSEHTREIFVYDFESASWSSLESPCQWISERPQHYCLDTLGAWNGRVFDVGEDLKPGRSRNQRGSLCVWELLDGVNMVQKWAVYDRLPKDLYSWLRSDECFHGFITKAVDVTVQASFSGDYMVVYSWDFRHGIVGSFCLFNMATKNWEKLAIRRGTVTTERPFY